MTDDGTVGVADILQLLSAFGSVAFAAWQDVDGDGAVNVGDILEALSAFGAIC